MYKGFFLVSNNQIIKQVKNSSNQFKIKSNPFGSIKEINRMRYEGVFSVVATFLIR